MSAGNGTLQLIAGHLVGAVAPLDLAFRDVDAFRTLMWRLGWDAQGLPPSYAAAADKAVQAVQAVDALADDANVATIVAVIRKVGDVYTAINTLAAAPPGVDPGAFLPEIGRRLFEYLLIEYLRDRFPALLMGLEAIGIVAYEDVPAAGTRPGFTRVRFDWEALPNRLSDPMSIPAEVYGWGTDHLKFGKVAEIFSELFIALGLHVSIDRVDRALSDAYQAAASGAPKESIDLGVSVALFDFTVGDTYYDVGFRVLELPAEGSALPGMIVQPLVPQGLAQSIDLTGGWMFKIRAGTDLANQLGIILRPDEIGVRYPFAPGTTLPNAGFGASLDYEAPEPTRLFGNPGGIRLELTKATLSADLNLKAGQIEFKTGIAPEAMTIVLSAADLDGFLGSALGGRDMRIGFPFHVSWSNRTGLDFLAGLGFEIAIYPHLNFGLLNADRVDLGLRFMAGAGEPPQLDLRASATLSGALGPLAYTVDRLGVHLPVTFRPGNAGPFDINFGVLWPTGLGLVIDAGAVTGGGFVSFDPDKGRYTGVVQLDLYDLGISAIAILDTKDAAGHDLPPPGFSFLMIVAVELPPIQLGFGFILTGVGGLAGINRRLDTPALLAGVRSGAVKSILFPDDPVRDAPTIISNLSTIFPVAIGRYVFGPAAIIGWGEPELIHIKLAVVLEVPAPITIALLGTANVALPEDPAIVSLNVDVVGVLDFGRNLLAVDASLRDSRVGTFALVGDMSIRFSFAAPQNFALAVGGLNPHFNPPPGFPTLRRVSVALGAGDNPRITIEGYLAITSNSRQFGAKAELYAAAAGFNVKGWLGFDALLTLHPLSFRYDFSAGMTLNRGSTRIAGITVTGSLTGPYPVHAWGAGSISVLFFDISVPFDHTFGERQVEPELPPVDPWPPLAAAIALAGNWSSEKAPGTVVGVSLRQPEGAADLVLLQPNGLATLHERVVPLNRTLERFGQYQISGPNRFGITDVLVADRPPGSWPWTTVTDHFAPGDFENLSLTDQLSRDSFEDMDAGVRVGAAAINTPVATLKTASLEYETSIIDAPWRTRPQPRFRPDRVAQLAYGLTGSKGRSAGAFGGRSRFARADGRAAAITLDPERWAVATTDTLTVPDNMPTGVTRGAAYLAVKHAPASARRGVQVVPVLELGMG